MVEDISKEEKEKGSKGASGVEEEN